MSLKVSDIEKMFSNPHPTVVLDAGHENTKVFEVDAPDGVDPGYINQHALAEISKEKYDEINSASANGDMSTFMYRNSYYIVGERAWNESGFIPRQTRLQRLKREYIGVIGMATIVRKYMEDHGGVPAAINLMIAHPPGDRAHTDLLQKAFYGTWKGEIGGRKFRTVVGYTMPYPEVAGAVHLIALKPDGIPYNGVEILQTKMVSIDLGGGTFDLYPVLPGGELDHAGARSEEIGTRQVADSFKAKVDALPEIQKYTSRSVSGVHIARIHEAMMSPNKLIKMPGRDNYIDVSKQFDEAVAPLVNRMYQALGTMARDLTQYDNVLVTGGGMTLLYNTIVEKVIPEFHDAVWTAGELDELVYANARGGGRLVRGIELLERNKVKPQKRKRR